MPSSLRSPALSDPQFTSFLAFVQRCTSQQLAQPGHVRFGVGTVPFGPQSASKSRVVY